MRPRRGRSRSAGTTAQTGLGTRVCDRVAAKDDDPSETRRRRTACRCWRGRRHRQCTSLRECHGEQRSRWKYARLDLGAPLKQLGSKPSRTWRTRCALPVLKHEQRRDHARQRSDHDDRAEDRVDARYSWLGDGARRRDGDEVVTSHAEQDYGTPT